MPTKVQEKINATEETPKSWYICELKGKTKAGNVVIGPVEQRELILLVWLANSVQPNKNFCIAKNKTYITKNPESFFKDEYQSIKNDINEFGVAETYEKYFFTNYLQRAIKLSLDAGEISSASEDETAQPQEETPAPAPAVEPEPEPEVALKPENTSEALEPDLETESEIALEPELESETLEPELESEILEPEIEEVAVVEPEPAPVVEPEPEPVLEPEVEVAVAEPEPEPVPAPEPTPVPTPAPAAAPVPEAEPVVIVIQNPEPEPETVEQPEQSSFELPISTTPSATVNRYQKESLLDYAPKKVLELPSDDDYSSYQIIGSPDSADSRGCTLLMKAAKAGNNWELKNLINSGASINLKDSDGWTALMYAVRYQENTSIVEQLIEAGANVKAKNNYDVSALMLAATYNGNPEILRKLLTYYSPSEKEVVQAFVLMLSDNYSSDYSKAAKVDTFIEKAISLNSFYNGKTPLMYAAQYCSSTIIIKKLLEYGAGTSIRSADGKTAFDYAKENPTLPHDDIYWMLNKK